MDLFTATQVFSLLFQTVFSTRNEQALEVKNKRENLKAILRLL